MSIFRRGGGAHRHGDGGGRSASDAEQTPAADAAATPAAARHPFSVPRWLREFGLASWLLIGLVLVILLVLAFVSSLLTLFMPMLFAALMGATFMPLADRLERLGLKRWLAALLVMLLIVLAAAGVALVVVIGVLEQFPTVKHSLNASADSISGWFKSQDIDVDTDKVKSSLEGAGSSVIKGVAGAVVHGVQSVSTLIFGIFIGLNILVYFLADGRGLARWASCHMPPVPQPVAYRIIANAARFLRGYIWGSTIIGLFNGGVMFVGALVLGVPLAATIGIVGWFTNYVPMFGAVIGGAFAVLIALGAGGLPEAVGMLIVVIVANGPLQTVVSQLALGAALKLHPLGVLMATTAGAVLFGAIGGIVAAPFLKIVMDASRQLRDAGLFDAPEATPDEEAGAPPGG